MSLRTAFSILTLDVDTLSGIFANLDVRSVCTTALSCRAFNTIVKENDLVKKAFEGHGISFPFVGYRYVEDQTVYVFDRSAILNGLRQNEETVRGVLTIRKRIGDDCLRMDVQVAGENVHPATERNISIRLFAFDCT